MDEIMWSPGPGRNWQMLGRSGANRGTLKVCDFRPARGFYILFDDYGASYVGLARGEQGLGQRLQKHARDKTKVWSRFCWFCFDDVVAAKHSDGWSQLKRRDAVREIGAETTVRELEALLIMVLGSRNQNQMKFIAGQPWHQVTLADCQRGKALTKVDQSRVVDWTLRSALNELD